VGLIVTAVVFLFGSVMATWLTIKDDPFRPTPAQFAVSAAVIVALVVAALRFPRHTAGETGWMPPPLVIGAVRHGRRDGSPRDTLPLLTSVFSVWRS
jgi:hypothetical protein